jgi:hypothetical protein
MHLCPFFYRPICGNWKTAIWIIDKFHIQNSNKITSYIKGALLWGVVELCGHPTRQSGIVGSEMNSLRGGGGEFICSLNFRFLNEIKENSVNCFDLFKFSKLF